MSKAYQEQFGGQYLAQGLLATQLGEVGIQTSDHLITRQPALPPELQLPCGWKLSCYKSAPLMSVS